jgi:hypothetical protein
MCASDEQQRNGRRERQGEFRRLEQFVRSIESRSSIVVILLDQIFVQSFENLLALIRRVEFVFLLAQKSVCELARLRLLINRREDFLESESNDLSRDEFSEISADRLAVSFTRSFPKVKSDCSIQFAERKTCQTAHDALQRAIQVILEDTSNEDRPARRTPSLAICKIPRNLSSS